MGCKIFVSLVCSSSFSNNHPGVGQVALYTLALRSSCYDLNTVFVNISGKTMTLLTHLKKQMEQEKEHIVGQFSFDI